MQTPCYEYNNSAVDARHDIVGYDARAGRESLELTDRWGFPDVEEPEQNERRNPACRVEGGGAGDRDPLSDDLVDDDEAGVLLPGESRHDAGRPDAGEQQRDRKNCEPVGLAAERN